MTLTRLTARAYAAGLAAVLTLAGCGDPVGTGAQATARGTAPATSTATTPTATGTTSAAEADPVLARIPAAARPNTRAGAEAFARFYFEQLDAASRAGDPQALLGLGEATCSTCEAFLGSVKALKDSKRRHDGQTVQVAESTILNFGDAGTKVLVGLNLQAVPIVDASGRVVGGTGADKGSFVATLAFDGHWKVAKLQVAK